MNTQADIRDEIDLMDYIRPLLSRWKLLFLIFVLGGTGSFFYSRTLPKQFASKASIYVQQSSGVMSLLRNLPVSTGGSASNMSGYLITLLQSQSMRLSVIDRLHLMDSEILFPKERPPMEEALEKLADIVLVSESKNGAINVKATTTDPQLSADIANTMLDLLSDYVVTASQKKIDFTYQKLQETEPKLEAAEKKLTKFLESNDVVALEEQTGKMIENLSEMDAKLVAVVSEIKEVESKLQNSGDMEALVELEVEKRALTSSKEYIESQRDAIQSKIAQLPEVATQYAKLKREAMLLGKSYELLTEQHEIAQITRKGEDGDYQIIDRAMPNFKKVGPRNSVNALIGALVCFFVAGVIFNIIDHRAARNKTDLPEASQ